MIRRHLEHVSALVEIDRAINFSFDLNLNLTTLLTHLMVQLGADAACALAFNPARGFHTRAAQQPRLPQGEGCAGLGGA